MCCPACHCPIRADEVQRYRMPDGVAFWQCPNCDACFPLAAEPASEAIDEILSDRYAARRQALAV
jgi:hypothetical protein